MKRPILNRVLPLLLANLAAPALAQTVTVSVGGVIEREGVVRGQLCGDAQRFPNGGCTFTVAAPASGETVELKFENVPPGRYAFQAFHDVNNDMRLGIPQEGYAFGNNQQYPPTFQAASFDVAGADTRHAVRLIHMAAPAAAGPERGAPALPGVVKTDLRANGLYGALYAPEGGSRLPTIIAIGGSEGGLDIISGVAQSFARHGYAVLALAYWRAPGLPQSLENVRLEYFDEAIAWLKTRPEVDGARIGMMGWSRGGEGALLIASRTPDIRAVMGLAAGSHVVVGISQTNFAASKPAWTLGGQPVPYFMPDMTVPMGAGPGGFRRMMDQSHRDVANHPEAEIPVERINGPILLFSGADDGVWNSNAQSERVMARLRAHDFRPSAQHIDYPNAGHLVFAGDPALPNPPSPAVTMRGVMGGTEEGNRAAIADSWTRALAFFDGALKAPQRGARP
jgi:dienelactone hydrolase/uncharacterized protein (DUF2141 family)